MTLKLRKIQARIREHPIRSSRIVQSSAGRHDQSRFLEVAIEDHSGAIGFGEAATTLIWSGESAESGLRLVKEVFAPALMDASLDHPSEALQVMDRLAFGNPFTKSAIDTALWDLWGRVQKKSVLDLIADREPIRRLPSRASIGAYPVEKTLQLATSFWQVGIRTFKFKIGSHGVDDVARLAAVREQLGDKVAFTVDANGAYSDADTAVREIEKLLEFDIALVEQPTPRCRMGLMAEVRRRLRVPILADEGIFSPDELEEAIESDAMDFVSFYPGKNGGFSRSLEMAARAWACGKPCTIGSNLETDLGQAASATLAAGLAAFPVTDVPGDFSSSLYYVESSIRSPLPFAHGELKVPSGEGFGVQPKDDFRFS